MAKPLSGPNYRTADLRASFKLPLKTGTATTGAATVHGVRCQVTSEALTTAAGTAYTLTLTNARIKAHSHVLASVRQGTGTQGLPVIATTAPADGLVVIAVLNGHATEALNGTIVIDCMVMDPVSRY